MNIVDPAVCKFSTILSFSKQLKFYCNERKIGTWFSKIQLDLSSYKKVLRLETETTQKEIGRREKIARVYAKILAQYEPEDLWILHPSFNYYELVTAIKKVFKRHILKNEPLFTTGIQIEVEKKRFLAKVEKKCVFLFPREGTLIGQGSYGNVFSIYEIASSQNLVFKKFICKSTVIEKEISNLNKIHDRALELNVSTNGLQDRPLALFKDPILGYIGPLYGIELGKWIAGSHSYAERIAMAKSLMIAYKNKTELGVWHGDLKPGNILLYNGEVVIIDWGGSLFFQDALDNVRVPAMYSSGYVNYNDKILQRDLREVLKIINEPSIKRKFLELSQAMEVFSMGVVLYTTLTDEHPYHLVTDEYGKELCDAVVGFKSNALNKYDEKIVQSIKRMITADYKNRSTANEAIEFWEKIC